MLKTLLALLSGVIFGLGLIVAGMANPAKVLAFLDVTGGDGWCDRGGGAGLPVGEATRA